MFRTGNPTLRNPAFQGDSSLDDLEARGRFSEGTRAGAAVKSGGGKHMTLQGTINKCAFAIGLTVIAAVACWNLALEITPEAASVTGLGYALTFGGMLIGFVLALIVIFKPRAAPFVTPVYAIAEGFFVGGISAIYAVMMGGRDAAPSEAELGLANTDTVLMAGSGGAVDAVMSNLNTELIFNAILLTFGIAGGMLAAYAFRLIRPNKMFYNIVITGTMGVFLYMMIAMGASMFGSFSLISVYDPNNGGMLSIGFSLLLVALASANLILDFDVINNGVKNKAPKYMEWYGAFAVLVTLVWLYVEVLRLLSKLQSRN